MPLSLIGSFSVMHVLGYSLNNLLLMAFTMSTGFVVDDAIVMIDNICRIAHVHPDDEFTLAAPYSRVRARLASASAPDPITCSRIMRSVLDSSSRSRAIHTIGMWPLCTTPPSDAVGGRPLCAQDILLLQIFRKLGPLPQFSKTFWAVRK